ncbi:MAG: Uma2 family endonuclease [Myxococcales bacterium]|nr:Uma2 family endonuclease [Myxococcales bacterium]
MDAAETIDLASYLAIEADSETKHEYLNGVVVAMAGASLRHNLIVGNLTGALRTALSDRDCFVLPTDQRLRVEATQSYTYPDVTVVCGRPRVTDERPPSLLNPTLLVEVLSESTWMRDLSYKLAHYRRIPTVEHLLFVSTDEQHILHYRRAESAWILTDHGPDGEVALEALGVALPLAEVYAKLGALE